MFRGSQPSPVTSWSHGNHLLPIHSIETSSAAPVVRNGPRLGLDSTTNVS
ncbi:hypothetical protein [Thermoactinomyces sp. DSM 45892]|nr:hypothetical protein [Thermoactinomyces sp. DSM 45892]